LELAFWLLRRLPGTRTMVPVHDNIAAGDIPVVICLSGGHEGVGVIETVGSRTPIEDASGRDR
jgi:hypothetical protein